MNQQQVLNMVNEKMGFVPNLLKTMSISPAPVQVYVQSALTMGHQNFPRQIAKRAFEVLQMGSGILAGSVRYVVGTIRSTLSTSDSL
jgi:hypothetical protein